MLQDAYYYGCQTQWRLDKAVLFNVKIRGDDLHHVRRSCRGMAWYGYVSTELGKYPDIFENGSALVKFPS